MLREIGPWLAFCLVTLLGAGQALGKIPVGQPCTASGDCQTGICEGEGCGERQGRCVTTRRRCNRDLVPYCTCEGKTREASSNCPGFTYRHKGACKDKPAAARPKADLDVRVVVSAVQREHVLRAVEGVREVYPYLVVEVIRRGDTEGERDALVTSLEVKSVKVGGRSLDLTRGRVELAGYAWAGKTLKFSAKLETGRLICQLAWPILPTSVPECVRARGTR